MSYTDHITIIEVCINVAQHVSHYEDLLITEKKRKARRHEKSETTRQTQEEIG